MKDKTLKFCGPKFKLSYAVIQIFLFYIALILIPKYDILCVLVIALTYLIPLYINSYFIKFVDRETKLSKYFISDTIYYFLPSVALSLLIEMVVHFMGKHDQTVGIYTVILFIEFLLLTLFQWLRYFVQYKMVKRTINKKADQIDSENE